MFDLNNAESISGELLPDGSFVKVTMAIRPGGIDGFRDIGKGLLRAFPGRDVLSLDCEFIVTDGPFAERTFLAVVHHCRRQDGRQRRLDRLEFLAAHVPGDDRLPRT